MPKVIEEINQNYMEIVMSLADQPEGISRPQIANELNVTKSVAIGLIKKCGLVHSRTKGTTKFYTKKGATKVPFEAPEAVKAATIPKTNTEKVENEPTEDVISELDAQILDTRQALHGAAAKAGKALGDWATHSALVDALRERMQDLATRRMNASS